MDDTTPTITNVDCFLALYDVTQKRNILCTTFDGLRLHSLSSKDIKLYSYKYSNISSKNDFDLVKAKLLLRRVSSTK